MKAVNKENNGAEENKKLAERKAYILYKEMNINKRETVLHKKEKYSFDIKEKNTELEAKNAKLEKLAFEYKTKAQSKGRVVSQELKEKIMLYHDNKKQKKNEMLEKGL